jgi:hypothetical protein
MTSVPDMAGRRRTKKRQNPDVATQGAGRGG